MPKVQGTNYSYSSDTNKNLNTTRASGLPSIGDNGQRLAVASTNISVYANNMRVGFVQSFNINESRTITPIHELGTEGVVQMAAGNTQGGTVQLSRFAVYNADLFNALGLTRTGKFVTFDKIQSSGTKDAQYQTYSNPFKTLKDQRVPLEVKAITNQPGENSQPYVETYIDCWITQYGKTISAQSITITETCTMTYSDIV